MKRVPMVFVLLLAACNPQPAHAPVRASASVTPTAPAYTVTGHGTNGKPARIFEQNGNRKVYQIVTPSYASKSAQNMAQAQFAHPTVTFYGKDGSTMTATAPQAAVRSGKQVVLSGGVQAKTSTGMTLTCDELTYDQHTETIDGTGHVRITGMQGGTAQTLTGSHFTSDVKLTNMVIN